MTGQIVILNGPSRSGKTTIANLIQETFDGVWMNLGMDAHIAMTSPRYRPGVGLRPHRTTVPLKQPGRVSLRELEDVVPSLYAALYESMAAHARLGLHVVADLYHHDFYSRPLGILEACAPRLDGLPVLFVGVVCSSDEIWRRREATWGQVRDEVDDGVRLAVELHQEAARSLTYDLELDTAEMAPQECVEAIRHRLDEGPPGSVLADIARSR